MHLLAPLRSILQRDQPSLSLPSRFHRVEDHAELDTVAVAKLLLALRMARKPQAVVPFNPSHFEPSPATRSSVSSDVPVHDHPAASAWKVACLDEDEGSGSPDCPSESGSASSAAHQPKFQQEQDDLLKKLHAEGEKRISLRPRSQRAASQPFLDTPPASRSPSPIPSEESDRSKTSAGSVKTRTCSFAGCGKTFTSTAHRTRHEKIHRGDKRYVCVECGVRSTRSDNLRMHRVKVHGVVFKK